MNFEIFRDWLYKNKRYCKETVSNIISRFKRANRILPWSNEIIYQFMLERQDSYKLLTSSVRSQIKKSVKLYFEFSDYLMKKKGNI